MNLFQKGFVIKILDSLINTLTNQEKLEEALKAFNEKGQKTPLTSKITESESWSKEEKLKLSAAIFEATTQATEQVRNDPYVINNNELPKEIAEATATFLDQYLPELTKTSIFLCRVSAVNENCKKLKAELMLSSVRLEPSSSPESPGSKTNSQESLYGNPWVFFSALTAATVAAVALEYTFKK